jgi:hypothetical protein
MFGDAFPADTYRSSSARSFVAYSAALLTIILVALPLFAFASQFEGAVKPVRVLLVVDASAPVSVDYRTTGRRLRRALMAGTLGIAPILIESKIASSEHASESKRLQAAVGPFDRRTVVIEPITIAAFEATHLFDLDAAKDPAAYLGSKKEVNLAKAKADGYPYVLLVREDFAGMITAWVMSTLSATSYLRYELYDTTTNKQLAKGIASGWAKAQHQLEPAISDKLIFLQEYPPAVGAAVTRMHGELNKQGHLHAMAEAFGLGKQVPAMGEVLDKYARMFDYTFKPPKGWHGAKGSSKFQYILEPTGDDRKQFGVVFSVDVLAEEFGQKVTSLDDYITLCFGRLRTQGFPVEDAQPYENLSLSKPHTALLLDRPNGAGKDIFLFRQLDDRFVVLYEIIFLADFDRLVQKYAKDVESLVNTAEITTRP